MPSYLITEGVLVAFISGVFGLLTIITKKRSEQKEEEPLHHAVALELHPFFVRCDMLKQHIQMTFVMTNKGKEAVFRDVLANQLDTFHNHLLVLAKKVDAGEIDNATHLYNTHMEALESIVKRHGNFFIGNQNYTHEEQQVMAIVMKKYAVWNHDKIQVLQDKIYSICSSPFYTTDYVRAAVILDVYLGVSVDTIQDAEESLGTINGDLKGLKFKNIVI